MLELFLLIWITCPVPDSQPSDTCTQQINVRQFAQRDTMMKFIKTAKIASWHQPIVYKVPSGQEYSVRRESSTEYTYRLEPKGHRITFGP